MVQVGSFGPFPEHPHLFLDLLSLWLPGTWSSPAFRPPDGRVREAELRTPPGGGNLC